MPSRCRRQSPKRDGRQNGRGCSCGQSAWPGAERLGPSPGLSASSTPQSLRAAGSVTTIRRSSLFVLWYELGYNTNNSLFLLVYWRRGRDSNPRWAFDPYSLSRGAPSAARPPLLDSPPSWTGGAVEWRPAHGGCVDRAGFNGTGQRIRYCQWSPPASDCAESGTIPGFDSEYDEPDGLDLAVTSMPPACQLSVQGQLPPVSPVVVSMSTLGSEVPSAPTDGPHPSGSVETELDMTSTSKSGLGGSGNHEWI